MEYPTWITAYLIIAITGGRRRVTSIHLGLINPNLDLFLSKGSLPSALVKMPAIWLAVLQKTILINPFSTLSIKKWCRTLICLVLLCWTGFFVILTALVLSQYNGTQSERMSKFSRCCLIHKSYAQHDATATYSTLALEKATEFCFLVPHEIKNDPRKWAIPEVLFYPPRIRHSQHQHIQTSQNSRQLDKREPDLEISQYPLGCLQGRFLWSCLEPMCQHWKNIRSASN